MSADRIAPKAMEKMRGFTMVELITVILISGILATVAIPRFVDVGGFKQRGFADEVKAALRFAQKTAIAQRRFVCVTFAGPSPAGVTLSIDTATDPGTAGAIPDCTVPLATGSVQNSAASFTATPANFYFNALGKPSFSATLNVDVNGNAIFVERETGYVR